MSRDRIFVIQPGFEDPNKPGTRYFCPYCNQIEGLLASVPTLAAKVEIVRVPFAKPREPVVALIGEDNQSLPVIVFGDEQPPPSDAKASGGHRFIDDTKRIIALLAERHGAPSPH